MKLKVLLFAAVFLTGILPLTAQVRKNMNYDSDWKRVDSLYDMGLPKSALEIVDSVYFSARSAGDDPQWIKAVIYRIKLYSNFREDFLLRAIMDLRKEIAEAKAPVTQILQSILAEVYSKYYQINLYRFRGRTAIAGVIPDSIQTWDLGTVTAAVYASYQASLSDEILLKSIPLGNYQAIVEVPGTIDQPRPSRHPVKGGKQGNARQSDDDRKERDAAKKIIDKALLLKPTLYDFLAGRALEFYTSADGPRSASTFFMNDAVYFSGSQVFSKITLPEDDPLALSPDLHAIRLYRDLEAFHLTDKNPAALIDVLLGRLDFAGENSTLEQKDSLHLQALMSAETTYSSSAYGTEINYRLAQFFSGLAEDLPLAIEKKKDRPGQGNLALALETCNRAIKRFPDSEGARNCAILSQTIQNPEYSLQAEAESAPGKPLLIQIKYKNTGRLFYRLLKFDQVEWEENKGKLRGDELYGFLAKQPALQTREQALAVYRDHRTHSQEAMIPGLDAGYYLLVASADADFSAASKLPSWCAFRVTSCNYITHSNPDGSLTLLVVDRSEGTPVPNCTVETWTRAYNYKLRKNENRKQGEFRTDTKGLLTLPAPPPNSRWVSNYMKIIRGEDVLLTRDFYQYSSLPQAEIPFRQTTFFTDRGIYRPGQTVYFKGIITERKGDETRLLSGIQTQVVFNDVNGRKISEQSFTTNEFGAFNGSFIAPTDVLPGMMNISNESGSFSFSVEEYKRPTFEVSFEPLSGNYKLNEVLTLKGKAMAYTGNAIAGAVVKYRVLRKARFPFWDLWYIPFPYLPETEIVSGTTKTLSDGSFSISFPAVPDPRTGKKTRPVYDFSVTSDVTDTGGETQSMETSLSVGYQSMQIVTSATSMMDLRRDSLIKVSSMNLGGKPTPASVGVQLTRLNTPGRVFIRRYWENPDTCLISETDFRSAFPYYAWTAEDDTSRWTVSAPVLNRVVFTGRDSLISLKKDLLAADMSLQAGVYCLQLSADDPSGQKVVLKKYITFFDPLSTNLAGDPANLFISLKPKVSPGRNAEFLIGTKEKNVTMIYEVWVHDSLASRQWMGLSGMQTVVAIPVTESCRGNFSVNFIFAKNGRTYLNSSLVNVPWPSKKLNVTFETFRSKILPGSREQWKIRISREKPISPTPTIELLATMYDASLDIFRPNSWSFELFRRYFAMHPWEAAGFNPVSSAFAAGKLPSGNIYEPVYPVLNWFGFNYFGNAGYGMRKSGRMDMTSAPLMEEKVMVADQERAGMPGMQPPPVAGEPPRDNQSVIETQGGPASGNGRSKPSPATLQLRKDFRETAFFYPDLRTDSSGALVLEFTAPDALTRWNVMGFAHDRSLDYGFFEKELLTQKDLMVIPNTPRFVRQGDEMVFTARVVNLSDSSLNTIVKLELFDGISMKPADSLAVNTGAGAPGTAKTGGLAQEIQIAKGGSAVVSWKIHIPEEPLLSLLQYRITARSGMFSDGEEKMIPVLPNRMMVTESLPLPVWGKETKDFSFGKLLNSSGEKTLKNYRLTLEFASNPAWYAIQALPSLNDKKYEDAYSVFSAFYSNSLAAHIMNSDTKIRAVFESWKSMTPSLLVSNLEKNEDLKPVLLQQTPWVQEARSETENRKRLGMYFDAQYLTTSLQKNLTKLSKLQSENGGWSWFEGMPESRGITQDIIGGFGKLSHTGYSLSVSGQPGMAYRELQDLVNDILDKGIRFMDEAFLKDYNELKHRYPAYLDENHLSGIELDYLYNRSFFLSSRPPDVLYREALQYYLGQAVKYWTKCSLDKQARLVLILDRFALAASAQKETARLILRSLNERAVHSPEMGMYWAPEQGSYFRRQVSVETQSVLIAAYDEVGKDPKPVDEMKVWLLKQKQTQMWESSRATADACYALLLRGTGMLGENPHVKISLGDIRIDPAKLEDVPKEAGTGYFRMSWSGKEITADMGRIRVSKSSDGVAWGAVYWQYFENLDKITPAETPLKLEKKIFVEQNTPNGPVLVPVPQGSSIQVGDKVKVRILLSVDRDLDFVHMRDMRASGLEPFSKRGVGIWESGVGGEKDLSGYRYQDGLGYYQSTSDVSTDFFFEHIGKGTYVFEYPLVVNAPGNYSNGITSVQCMYAPEFAAHSEGIRLVCK